MERQELFFSHGGLAYQAPHGASVLPESVQSQIVAVLRGQRAVVRASYVCVAKCGGEDQGFQFAVQFDGATLVQPPVGIGKLFEHLVEQTKPLIRPMKHHGVVFANNLGAAFGPEGAARYLALSQCLYDRDRDGTSGTSRDKE